MMKILDSSSNGGCNFLRLFMSFSFLPSSYCRDMPKYGPLYIFISLFFFSIASIFLFCNWTSAKNHSVENCGKASFVAAVLSKCT